MKPPRPPRCWVFPNRNAIGLVAVLGGMWWAGSSQNNGAAYLLCFLLTAVALVSSMHVWANVSGVVLEADAIRPVFVGDDFVVPLHASIARTREHFGIRASAGEHGAPVVFATVPSQGSVAARLRVRALERGFFQTLTVRVESRFPLGFFTARKIIRLNVPHHIYPAPAGNKSLPASLEPGRPARDGSRTEGDDFGGFRAWRTGESQRHIDWKAAARGQPLLVKEWTGDSDSTAMLDWAGLPGLPPEARLGQLARWIAHAERGGDSYGLKLPGVTLPPSRGDRHFHACMRRLAEFPRDGAARDEQSGASAGAQ